MLYNEVLLILWPDVKVCSAGGKKERPTRARVEEQGKKQTNFGFLSKPSFKRSLPTPPVVPAPACLDIPHTPGWPEMHNLACLPSQSTKNYHSKHTPGWTERQTLDNTITFLLAGITPISFDGPQ